MAAGHTEHMAVRVQVDELKERSEDALERAAESSWLERLARAGLVARGLLYVVVALLAVQVARGEHGERADKQGALQAVVRQPFGKVLVLVLAIGFAGYALWRFVEAAVGPPDEDDPRKALGKRLFSAARGVLYTAFFASAVRLLIWSGSRTDPNAEADWTGRVLDWPGGTWLVEAAGAAVIGGGLYVGWRGLTGKFRKRLKAGEMGRAQRRWILGLGTSGMIARMVVTVLIGIFLMVAAVRHQPDKAVGIDGALKALAARSFGPALLVVVAVGLAAYGAYSFAEARYRRIGSD